MVRRGDSYRFIPHYGKTHLSVQTVTLTKVISSDKFWCQVRSDDDELSDVLCFGREVPDYGSLEVIGDAPTIQHDQISLEEWRQKARSRNWPRGG